MEITPQYVDNLRHSCAHLLAQAVLELFPGTQLTIGPTTKHGFFYDFLPVTNFKEEDLPLIEARMHEIAKRNLGIVGGQVPKEEARPLFADNRFKCELMDGIEGDTVGVYYQGDFYDLCKGGHVHSTGELKHFKLTSISGSYWRADRNGQPLQRISGVAFATKQELKDYLKAVEEAKRYDHRVLGKQLGLFSFHQESPGSAFFHDKGTTLFNTLVDYARCLQKELYQEIKTPLILHESLWKTSGHYDNYKDNMYFTTIDEDVHCVRPMNCPCGVMVYKEDLYSYRHLPVRFAEFGLVHRYELSGVLHGLFRVRSFTQDDAHIFCRPDQIEEEVVKVLEMAQILYARFGFTSVRMALSTKPEKAMGDDALWESATQALAQALQKRGVEYTVQEGEGAFYGPKIELLIQDAMGREWQCGTVQVDFFLPQRFALSYVDADQSRKTPVMIHRALYGSIERFMGMLIEHYKGHFPLWLAPEQVRILTITDEQAAYAAQLYERLKEEGVRVVMDTGSDKISAKIKRAQLAKIPFMLVLGNQERDTQTMTLRYVSGEQKRDLTYDAFKELYTQACK